MAWTPEHRRASAMSAALVWPDTRGSTVVVGFNGLRLVRNTAGRRAGSTTAPAKVNILSAPTLLAIDVDITSQQLTDAVIHVPDRVVMLGCEANVGSVGGTLVEGWNTDEPSEHGIQVFNRMSLVRADIHGGVGRLAQEVTRTGRCPIAASEDGYPPGASGRLLKVMVRPSVLSRMSGPVSTSALCAEHIQYSQAHHGVGFPALITPTSSEPTTTHCFMRPGFLV
jgi:hypothetical protein